MLLELLNRAMVTPATILQEVIEAVETGQPIDFPRIARLQALALVQAGDAYIAESLALQEEQYEQFRELASGTTAG